MRQTLKNVATLVAAALALSAACDAQTKSTNEANLVFRAPFVLKLRIDGERYYEQKFGTVPYVADNNVYLFAGDQFGINATIVNDKISRISYQPDLAKADVDLSFTQQRGASAINGATTPVPSRGETSPKPLGREFLRQGSWRNLHARKARV